MQVFLTQNCFWFSRIPYIWVQFLNAGMYIIGWREYLSNWACFVFTCAAGSLNGVSQRSGSRVASTSTSCKYGWGNKEALPGVPWVPTRWGEQGQQQHPLPQLLLHLDHLPQCQCVFVFVFFVSAISYVVNTSFNLLAATCKDWMDQEGGWIEI